MTRAESNIDLQIQIDVSQASRGYPGLRLSESVQLSACGFLDVCSILAQFHELAEKLKRDQVDVPGTVRGAP